MPILIIFRWLNLSVRGIPADSVSEGCRHPLRGDGQLSVMKIPVGEVIKD